MEKIRNYKNRIILLLLAIILPLSTCGMLYSLINFSRTYGDDTTSSYHTSYMEEVSMTNNSFDSSSSTYSLSTSLSGWTGQVSDKKTTAGIINVGTTFQTYMSSTYYLSSNPQANGSDNHILMINSRTSSDEEYTPAHQGYKSSDITLEANSYYSFEVSFKSDTNYASLTDYEYAGALSSEVTISQSYFNGSSSTEVIGFGTDDNEVYIIFSYNSHSYYLRKQLQSTPAKTFNITDLTLDEGAETPEYYAENVTIFYDDGEYIGVVIDDVGYFISYEDIEIVEETEDETTTTSINIKDGAKGYLCENITYNPSSSNYTVSIDTPYYNKVTTYTPMSASSYGSIYLTQDDEVIAEFTQVQSKNWVTFYIFVATGDEEVTVNLELWLGSEDTTVSGVVFYDECHIFQYSENAFWTTYQTYYDFDYTQEYVSTDSNGTSTSIETVTTNCTTFVDLRDEKYLIDVSDLNFDFESGVYNNDVSSLYAWTKDENSTGNARVFDVSSPSYFKTLTGYSFVGSMMTCEVELDENNKVQSLSENTYVLALWADDEYIKVTSGDINIGSNEIYKITVYYKISELDGNIYMFVEENDYVLEKYNLSDYTLTEETASSAVTENGDDEFINNYGTIEFYVKGSALYDSSFNISLGLGSSSETATGCVVFDNITIEKASTEDYSSATNAVELGTISSTPSITNGNFNSVTITADSTAPYSPDNWTITGSDTTYGGVINTDADKYAEYQALREEYSTTSLDNPYFWAYQTNPGSPNSANNDEVPDNVLMLANMKSNSWQNVISDSFALTADTAYKLSFSYKTSGISTSFTVSIYYGDSDSSFVLFTSDALSTSNRWETYDIYIQSFSGESNIYIRIDFGTEDDGTSGFAYFDNFKLESDVTIPDDTEGENTALIDMSDFFLNIPSNSISGDLTNSSSPAYSASISTGSSSMMSGGIVSSEKFGENSQFKIDSDESTNVFFIQSQGEGSYILQSNFSIDLEAETYYVLSFKLKTYFDTSNLDPEKTYSYGATIGLTGFDYATGLISNDEYTTYKIYFYASEETSANLYIALICDAAETKGSMVVYDFNLETVESDDYTSALSISTTTDYDINSEDGKVFVASADETVEEDTSDDDETDDDDDTENVAWLYIPSIIFGLAIVIAVIGFFMRKIKIKKIELKRKEEYDRKTSLNVEAIKLKARQVQEEEIKAVEQTREKFQKELESLEKEHKQKILSLRETENGKVSKATDKEFKLFAQKRTVIAERIETLNKQIEEIKTPEYMLNLERKVYAQEEMKRRELEKYSKKRNKEIDKNNETKSDK